MKKKTKKIYRTVVFGISFLMFFQSSVPEIKGGLQTEAAIITEQFMGTAPNLVLFAKDYEEKLAEAEKKRAELEKKKAQIEAQIRENEQKKSDLLAYIEQLDMQIGELNEEIEKLESDIVTAEEDLAKTRVALAEAEKTEAEQYEAMKRRIQYMYENGETSILELFLGSSSLSDLLNRVECRRA